jgi:hypothetical protein
MKAMSSSMRSEPNRGLLPSVLAPSLRPARLKIEQFPNIRPSVGMLEPLAFARYLIVFFIGVTATLAWQSYGGAAREIIANLYPQPGWFGPQDAVAQTVPDTIELAVPAAPSPDRPKFNATSFDLDVVGQSIEQIARSQGQMTRSVEQLAIGQEQVMREITKLQAIEQYVLERISTSAPRPVAPQASKRALQSPQAPTSLLAGNP